MAEAPLRKLTPPLVMGGQGRTPEQVAGNVRIMGWIVAVTVALVLLYGLSALWTALLAIG